MVGTSVKRKGAEKSENHFYHHYFQYFYIDEIMNYFYSKIYIVHILTVHDKQLIAWISVQTLTGNQSHMHTIQWRRMIF